MKELKQGTICKHKIHGYKLKIIGFTGTHYRCHCLDNTPLMHTILNILPQNLEVI